MSTKLRGLLAGIKRAVVGAHRSFANQHMEELAQYFIPAPGQPPGSAICFAVDYDASHPERDPGLFMLAA